MKIINKLNDESSHKLKIRNWLSFVFFFNKFVYMYLYIYTITYIQLHIYIYTIYMYLLHISKLQKNNFHHLFDLRINKQRYIELYLPPMYLLYIYYCIQFLGGIGKFITMYFFVYIVLHFYSKYLNIIILFDIVTFLLF